MILRYTDAYVRSLPTERLLLLQNTYGRAIDMAITTHQPAATFRSRYLKIFEELARRRRAITKKT